jgi:hypothetical protein
MQLNSLSITKDSRSSVFNTIIKHLSLALEVSQLRALLDLWKKQDKDYPEVAVWEQTIKDIIDHSIIVYLRYIGMTNTYSSTERYRVDRKS